jgi:hypothetical protein
MSKQTYHILNWNMRGVNTSAQRSLWRASQSIWYAIEKPPPSTTAINGTLGSKITINIAFLQA